MTTTPLRAFTITATLFLAAPAVAQPTPPHKEKPKLSPVPLPAPGPLKARPGDDAVRVLRVERHNALLELVARYKTTIEHSGGTREDLDAYLDALSKFTAARLELEADPAERVAVLKVLVELFRRHDEATVRRFEVGNLRPHDVVRARVARLDAELRLAEELAAAPRNGTPPAQAVPLAPACAPSRRLPWRR